MSCGESNPPRSAVWLLRHACPGNHNEALTGDLVEKFREGRSHGWFWKQVLIAIAVGVLGEVRRHWPHFSYAIAGTAMRLSERCAVKSLSSLSVREKIQPLHLGSDAAD